MPVVPESSASFRDPSFWKQFYKNASDSFEWYGDFNTFGSILIKYLKSTDKILQIGCGNSELAAQLYDNGYRAVSSIDIDQGVIDKQIARNKTLRPELQFSCCSALDLRSPEDSYNVVLDKGTLDALLPSEKEGAAEEVQKMFAEVCRVLTFGGRYIVVSLAQEHVLRVFLSYFLKNVNFMIRIEKISDVSWSFAVPAFLLIATKLRLPIPFPYMELLFWPGSAAVKLMDKEDVISAVVAEQEFSRFCHLCSKKLSEEATITLSGKDGRPRYRITVIDDAEIHQLVSFAVFIVPIGRDNDWIFSTRAGHIALRKQCDKSRLALVSLFRDQTYENMMQVQDELRPYVKKLTPANLKKSQEPSVEYLSLGEVDARKTRACGRSTVNGHWVVEDVRSGDSLYRRLIFLSSPGVIQSEARIISTFEHTFKRKGNRAN
ncbi:unnamed protein product [Gongylonema pulchrum]|uniref:Methyltranfer_dom domain-containing protein n=1 Tax=Gongylonema pulchrum TaxID=637853 RepID=A0A183DUU8_9BILA|nr:unnamed protein product [Gongylonema pulchrum]